eukprot:gene7243-8012_t
MEEVIKRVKELKSDQLRQIVELELQLETTPRDSRFSNTLIEMMRKEETMLRDSANNTSATAAVVQKVDDLLKQETRAFFNKVTSHNMKKWQSVRNRQYQERRAIQTQINEAVTATSSSSAGAVRSAPLAAAGGAVAVGAIDLDREAQRLLVDYYKNWQHYELIHLQEAFKTQSQKIDHEWGSQEVILANEFQEKKERICGKESDVRRSQGGSLTSSLEHSGDRRWHHPEKQQTLIHTAPVISPQRPRSQSRLNGSALGELARIEKEYEEALTALEKQKTDAKRWLLRQQIRFAAQSEELRREKFAMAQILEELLNEFDNGIR